MKTKLTLIVVLIFMSICTINAQILCIYCFDDSLHSPNPTAPNLVLNGSFEAASVSVGGYYCPASSSYAGDINNWLCTGGGLATYAQLVDSTYTVVADSNQAAYLGSAFSTICPDLTSNCVISVDCEMAGFDTTLYPDNAPEYGGRGGVSIEQTITGLVPFTNYILDFWAGGEAFNDPGIFGVDIGFGKNYLKCVNSNVSSPYRAIRYIIVFRTVASSHTIKFTNWGHMCSSCSEVMLDDVRLYKQSDAVHPFTCTHFVVNHLIDTTLCLYDSINILGTMYRDSGSFSNSLTIGDTTHFYNIHISFVDCSTPVYINIDTIICRYDSISILGTVYSDSGSYVVIQSTRDTTFNYNIHISLIRCDYIFDTIHIDTIICEYDSIQIYSNVFKDSGSFVSIQIFGDTSYRYYIHISYKDCTEPGPEIDIPSAFSPNGDGKNDYFIVYGKNVSTYRINIFNRWGELVYESSDLTKLNVSGWDGTYKGAYQSIGTYIYKIDFGNAEKIELKKGNLELIR